MPDGRPTPELIGHVCDQCGHDLTVFAYAATDDIAPAIEIVSTVVDECGEVDLRTHIHPSGAVSLAARLLEAAEAIELAAARTGHGDND
jgi:hypothetical protein